MNFRLGFLMSIGFLLATTLLANLDLAQEALADGNEILAKEHLTQIINRPKREKDRAQAIILLSLIEHTRAGREKLLKDFYENHRLDPAWSRMAYELGWFYANQDAYLQAQKVFVGLTNDQAYRSRSFLALIKLAILQDDWQQAEALANSLGNESSSSDFLFLRAEVYFAQGRLREAAMVWQEIVERHSRSREAPAAWLALGELALSKKDNRLAGDYFSKLTNRFPKSIEAGLARSQLRLLANDKEVFHDLRVWEIQLAVFFKESQAATFVEELKKKGYQAFLDQELVSGKTQYSARIGFFVEKKAAEELLSNLILKGYEGFIRTRTVKIAEGELGRDK